MTEVDIKILYVTVPDAETAERIGRALIEDRLAACVNILPGMRSLYRWRDAIETCEETVLIVKTTKPSVNEARKRIISLHPHEIPCVIVFPVDRESSHSAYLDWLIQETSS